MGDYICVRALIMENQMEKKMENEMETAIYRVIVEDYRGYSLNS